MDSQHLKYYKANDIIRGFIPFQDWKRLDLMLFFYASLFFVDDYNLVQCCYSKIMPCQIAECWIKPVTTLHSEIINICAWLSFSEFFYDDTKHLYLPNTLIINIYHPCSRVQWFWQFFRNSICFMCFWFGLEILILVHKKVFFEILNGFYLIWPFILQKK